MPGSFTLRKARLVLPDRVVTGDLVIEDGLIQEIAPTASRVAGELIDATGLTVLPGVVDLHGVLTGDGSELVTEARAAAAGGVTAMVWEPPVSDDPTATVSALLARARYEGVPVSYGFYAQAHPDHMAAINEHERLAGLYVPAARLDNAAVEEVLSRTNKLVVFDGAGLRGPAVAVPGAEDDVWDENASLEAVRQALRLAQIHGVRLHLSHLHSAAEVELLSGTPVERITAHVTPQHLLLSAPACYGALGEQARCVPPIRERHHAVALWYALREGMAAMIASDHTAVGGDAPPGMPSVEWMLPALVDLATRGQVRLQQVARWLSEQPARALRIPRKGRLELGYDGDIVVLDTERTSVIGETPPRTGAGWSPFTGRSMQGAVVMTAIRGRPIFRDGELLDPGGGRELAFAHPRT